MNKKQKTIDFQKYLVKRLKDEKFRNGFEQAGKQLELACQMNALRVKKKLSQKMLAKKLKTTQSAVARMETGRQNFSIAMLERIADVFDCHLKIDFVK